MIVVHTDVKETGNNGVSKLLYLHERRRTSESLFLFDKVLDKRLLALSTRSVQTGTGTEHRTTGPNIQEEMSNND